ncbi:MAG: thiamine pyrophosphate-requiring protein [Alphaproteobacteria bacterium]
MATKTIESGTVADAYLAILADRGVDFLFANAGTDFAPLIEALAKAQTKGTPTPRPITVPHENVAMAMAIGHYMVSGRPQLVMVHVNVGTTNAMCNLVNASKGNIPILFSAGRTPYTETGNLTGKRSVEIHWPQEMRDQASILREFVKWDYELHHQEVVETAVDRALNIAMSEPRGPIYLTLPRETLAAEVENFTYTSPTRHKTPSPPHPDKAAVDEAAQILADAKNPLIITSGFGARPADVPVLEALAESFALPVVQRKPRYMVLPCDHPMHIGYNPDAHIEDADVVLVLECDVPWIPGKITPPDDCKIIHIGTDPLFSSYPIRGFTCDLAITGIPGATLALLTEALGGHAKRASKRIDARRKRIKALRDSQSEARKAVLDSSRDETPIHPAWISHCIDNIRDDDAIVIKESPLAWDHLGLTQPGTFFCNTFGGGLGYGLGTALGAKLAAPGRQVICTVGDGAYMFGNPIPAHYVGAAEGLPTLTVIFNNEMWGAVKRNTRDVYPSGYAAQSNNEPLTYFVSGTRFERAVEISDGYGEQVDDPAQVPAALDRAMDAVAGGRQAVLNILCKGP